MGFLKKLRESSEKAVEKGAEVGTKAYDGTKEAVQKGRKTEKEQARAVTLNISSCRLMLPESHMICRHARLGLRPACGK